MTYPEIQDRHVFYLTMIVSSELLPEIIYVQFTDSRLIRLVFY
jgi:hypothetical protein